MNLNISVNMCNLACCHSMLASFLCMLNTFSLVVGAIITGMGIYGFVEMENYFAIMGEEYVFTSTVLITLGAIILIISFIGCCGTCTETSWMVRSYRLGHWDFYYETITAATILPIYIYIYIYFPYKLLFGLIFKLSVCCS